MPRYLPPKIRCSTSTCYWLIKSPQHTPQLGSYPLSENVDTHDVPRVHLNCSRFLKCTRTGITYTLRHNFACTLRNLIYVITYTKCHKQYVGLTTQQLNVRINHHRPSIFNNKTTYLPKHINLPDHSIKKPLSASY